MVLPHFLVPIALASPAVIVEGGADCPSPTAVSGELARIMTVPEIEGPGDSVQISSAGDTVTVSLRNAEGAVLGERRVSAEGTCEERARAAAVIVAAWLTDIHPEYRNALPQDAPPATPPPAPPPPLELTPPPKVEPPAPSPGARRFSAALALGVELSDAGATPAFELSTRFAFEGTGLGVLAFALFALPEERELGSGTALSFRWPFGVGPLYRLRVGEAFIDLGAGPTIGWLHAEGEDFARNESDNDVVLGAFGAARVFTGGGFLRPFASACLLGWFTKSTVVAHVPEAEFTLPAVEGLVLLGASVDL
jgi:hypothetical protein